MAVSCCSLIKQGASAPYLTKKNMTIYLRHPEHGTKVATMELEAEYDEKNGWVRYTHDTPSISVEESAEEAAPVNTLEKRTRRKTSE